MKLLHRRGARTHPKEREKGQENSPSPLPLLGKRMIPPGEGERNYDNAPIGLSLLKVQNDYDNTYRLTPIQCTSAGV
jgi:hypothetical protein